MKVVTTAILLASTAITTIAQAQTYEWEEALCSYKGEFNSKKYTAKQVDNSYQMLNQFSSSNLDGLRVPQTNAQLHQMSYSDVTALDIEYLQVKNNIENLHIVPQTQPYKQALLKTIEGEYTASRLTLLAYVDPAEAIKQSPAMCTTYIEPLLQSDSAIQNRWRQAVDDDIQEQVTDYADYPDLILSERDRVMQRYEEDKAENAYLKARNNLISYRFYNCVKSTVYYPSVDEMSMYSHKLSASLFGSNYEQDCDSD